MYKRQRGAPTAFRDAQLHAALAHFLSMPHAQPQHAAWKGPHLPLLHSGGGEGVDSSQDLSMSPVRVAGRVSQALSPVTLTLTLTLSPVRVAVTPCSLAKRDYTLGAPCWPAHMPRLDIDTPYKCCKVVTVATTEGVRILFAAFNPNPLNP